MVSITKNEKVRLMEEKLANYVTFISGINPTRAKKQYGEEIIYYEQNDFNNDYNHLDGFEILEEFSEFGKQTLQEGDVVISNLQQKAAIVGKSNAGKVISLNFTKVDFTNKQLDKNYFLYLFNSNKSVQREKERAQQGYINQKISTKDLNELVVPIVSIEQQKKIGAAYSRMLKLQGELQQYSTKLDQFAIEIFEKTIKGR